MDEDENTFGDDDQTTNGASSASEGGVYLRGTLIGKGGSASA
jgi:hypothetical protein